jgi:hypothetical protein
MIKKNITKKKLTPASISSRPRKEAFDKSDAAFLRNKPKIELGDFVDAGMYGAFHKIKNNDKLGIKVPRCDSDLDYCSDCENKKELLLEAKMCRNLANEKMIIPTRTVPIKKFGNKCIGLVRPMLNVVNDAQLTPSQLKQLRSKLIELSRKGIAFYDGLQFGFTASGRVMQFDMGRTDIMDEAEAFSVNRANWLNLLASHKNLSIDVREIGDVVIVEALAKARTSNKMHKYQDLLELQALVKKYGDIV